MRARRWLAAIGAVLIAVRAAGAVTIGPDAFGYIATNDVSFAFEDLSGAGDATRVLTADDDQPITFGLGFLFGFYGGAFSQVSWTPNGLMTFTATSTQFTNVDLETTAPTADVPTVAVLWDDWESTVVSGTDGTYYATRGPDGDRRFILQWNALRHQAATGTVTFQAVLFEASGDLLFQYDDVLVSSAGGGPLDNGASATVGIRDTGGQDNGRSLQWSFNQAVIGDGEAIRFSVIPEPVTMAGLVMGVGGLVGYYVRRRKA